MLRLLADENLNHDIVRGVLRREAEVDLVLLRDAGLSGADDPTVLEWAARAGRVLLTHDVATVTRYAYERVRTGRPMPGVFEIPSNAPRSVIDDVVLLAECSVAGEWEGQVRYLPLR